MRGKAIVAISPPRDVCIFCALRFGQAPQPLRRQFPNQNRTYRASTRYDRPPAAAYAVREDEPDEPPQSIQGVRPPPKPAPTAWPTFVPRKSIPKTIEPATRPPEQNAANIGPSNWKCSSCGNVNLSRRTVCGICKAPKSGPTKQTPVSNAAESVTRASAEKPLVSQQSSWKCSTCGTVNLGKRNQCADCSEPKVSKAMTMRYHFAKMQQEPVRFLIQQAQSDRPRSRRDELSGGEEQNQRSQPERSHKSSQQTQSQKPKSRRDELLGGKEQIQRLQSEGRENPSREEQGEKPKSRWDELLGGKSQFRKVQLREELSTSKEQTRKVQSRGDEVITPKEQISKLQANLDEPKSQKNEVQDPQSREEEVLSGKEPSQKLTQVQRKEVQEPQSRSEVLTGGEAQTQKAQTANQKAQMAIQETQPTTQQAQVTSQQAQPTSQQAQSTTQQAQPTTQQAQPTTQKIHLNLGEILDEKDQAPKSQSNSGDFVDQKQQLQKVQPNWGGFLDQQKQAQNPQSNWGGFLDQQKQIQKPQSSWSGSLDGKDHAQLSQRQLQNQDKGSKDEMILGSGPKYKPLHFGDSVLEARRERPLWRRPTDSPYDGRGSMQPSLFQDPTRRLPFRVRLGRGGQSEEPERQDLFRINRMTNSVREDREPPAGASPSSTQPLFQSRETPVNRSRSTDTGDRSGLEALLQHNAETDKSKSRSRIFAERNLPIRRWPTQDTTLIEGDSVHQAHHSLQQFTPLQSLDPMVPERPTSSVSVYQEEEGESDMSRHRRDYDKSRSLETEEEGRQRRGRFHADLDEPEIAEAKAVARHMRRPARNASNRKNAYELEDPDDDLLFEGRGRKKKKAKAETVEAEPARPSIQLPEFISVENLAKGLRVRIENFINRMEEMGFERPRHDHILDAETSALIASEFNFDPTYSEKSRIQDLVARPVPEDVSALPSRPPIVTIMGHVDHGKTTLLDWLRKSSVVESEHGGITQHIGAFSVAMPGGKQITFLDTPGHAAFLDMRRRGANVTDIVILVVAADDSVKPQTLEAIKHAADAKVPIIVAMNKVDKEDANVDRVKQDLARHGVTVEDYGGDVQAIPVSGKFGKGMAELEEATVTLSELLDHRAEIDGPVEGWIIESKVTTAGRVATMLVRRGTLRPGDIVVAGNTWARIRTLRNDAGTMVDEAPPGTPIQIDGWRGEDPLAGWEVLQAENEDQAKEVVELRQERQEYTKLADDTAAINTIRAEEADARAKVLAWEAEQEWAHKRGHWRPKDNAGWVEGKASSGPKQVHFVVKADVSGSVEAVVNSVSAIGNNEVAANVIRSGVGVIKESDIQHLASSGEVGYLISFNQPVDASMSRSAEAAGLEILDYNIIYKVTDVVREKLTAELPPVITQKVVGEAEIGKVFEISIKKGKTKIAGCKISNGVIMRDKKIRVLRKSQVLYDGSLHSLKNVKKDVSEMRKGSECGIGFENWEDFQEGDLVQCYEEQKTQRTL